jgi:hypothetical protein
MERVKVLIDKLVQQQQRNEGAEAMLITTQLLQNELLLLQKKNAPAVASKVAVVMPSSANPVIKREPKTIKTPEPKIEEPAPIPAANESLPEPVTEEFSSEIFPVTAQPEPEPFSVTSEEVSLGETVLAAERPEHEAYLPPKQKVQEPMPEPEKIVQPLIMDNHFDAVEETPTLAQYQPSKKDIKLQKEINDLIGETKETLNDRLKEDKKELAHKLKDTPIKDLRKAIGVNDRFVFVNELFRGDETMYERSIKTINGFHILPEAEYWINRELKVKLGWDDYKDSVQHFYHLVRRRFS